MAGLLVWLTHRPYRANNAKQKYPSRQYYRSRSYNLRIMKSCSLIEVVALLRRHSELEVQILNGHGATEATERELEATIRRLAAHPHASPDAPLVKSRSIVAALIAKTLARIASSSFKWPCRSSYGSRIRNSGSSGCSQRLQVSGARANSCREFWPDTGIYLGRYRCRVGAACTVSERTEPMHESYRQGPSPAN
jgi:hypothetical protein